jgi:putative ABC transport system permease protein
MLIQHKQKSIERSPMPWKNPQTRLSATVQVLGFDPEVPAFNLPDVNQQLAKIKLPDVVLFDRGARGIYAEAITKVERGETITTEVDNRTLSIGGLFKLGASFGADAIGARCEP